MKKYFGTEEYESLGLEDERLDIEVKRFQGASAGRLLGRLREAGESVWGGGGFWVCPNGTQIEYTPSTPGSDVVEWARQGGFQVAVRENMRMHEGFHRLRLSPQLSMDAADDLILGHKMMRGLGSADAWAAPLRSHEMLGTDAGFYHLAAAETLAFDGIFCDAAAPWLPAKAREPFYRFYRAHEQVLQSGAPVAEVGVLCFMNELHRDAADTVRETRLVTDWLSEAHVLWDAILDDRLTPESLSGYRLVFVPNVRMLDDGEVDTLLAFARRGGALVVSGEVATAYRCGVRRERPAFAGIVPACRDEAFAVRDYGQGRIAACPRGFADVDVPEAYRGSDVEVRQPGRGLMLESNRAVFLACLDRAAGQGLSSVVSPGHRAIRVAARRCGEEPSMTVHLANYDLEVVPGKSGYTHTFERPSQLTPAEQVAIAVPVPAGHRASQVQWSALPETGLEDLPFEPLGDGVRFTIPRVNAYSFAVVHLAQDSKGGGRSLSDVRSSTTAARGTLPVLEATGQSPQPPEYASRQPPSDLEHVLYVSPGVPVVVSGEAGKELQLRLDRPGRKQVEAMVWSPLAAFDVNAEADRGTIRWLRFWLISPSGKIAASGAVPADRSTQIRIAASETGLYALVTEGGLGQLAISTTSRCLMASARAFQSEEPNARLYFFVPEGVSRFQMTTGGLDDRMHLRVFDGSGALRLERNDFHIHHRRHEIEVPAGQDGRAWSITFDTQTPPGRRAGRRTEIDLPPPLPGFLSPAPARLVRG